MAIGIIKQFEDAAASNSNVLAFPARPPVVRPVPHRKTRKTKRSNVLPFTGVTRRNYDVKAELPGWKEAMAAHLAQLMAKIGKGEVTGLAILSTGGIPKGAYEPEGKIDLFGVHCADFNYLASVSEYMAERAREHAQKYPARAV